MHDNTRQYIADLEFFVEDAIERCWEADCAASRALTARDILREQVTRFEGRGDVLPPKVSPLIVAQLEERLRAVQDTLTERNAEIRFLTLQSEYFQAKAQRAEDARD